MPKVKIDKELYEFLKSEGILGQFKANFISPKCSFMSNTHRTVISKLSNAFGWSSTPEGYGYWLQIADKFNNISDAKTKN